MTYALSAWLFTRLLGLIYVVAFVSLALEARGLWGTRGVLPVAEYLGGVGQVLGSARYARLPTLFWFLKGDAWLTGLALVGAAAGLLATCGVATGWMLATCFALYLSYVGAGQDFLSFQWDSLLLEVGFLALFAVPWRLAPTLGLATEPHALVRYGFYLVLFKLMFLSGVVKILSGDPSWRDLSALGYHYWTQPLPNPVSPFVHALPGWLHRAATLGTFAVELILPFLIAWPPARVVVAAGFTMLSLFILATGNYTFFNYLTIALCAWLVPDSFWSGALGRLVITPAAFKPGWVTGVTLAVLSLANLGWCVRHFAPAAVNRAFTPLLAPLQAWHVSNPYGLFATMTTSRPEIVIEGSDDGEAWREYVFTYKPGPVDRRPPWIAPLQPRLEWQMWFAALSSFRRNEFVGNLMARLFEGSPDVRRFFAVDPFPDEPPRFLRARLYEYEFRAPGEIYATGEWWDRRLVGEYSPPFRR